MNEYLDKEDKITYSKFDLFLENHINAIEIVLVLIRKAACFLFFISLVALVFMKSLSPLSAIILFFIIYMVMYKLIDIITNCLEEYIELGREIRELDLLIEKEEIEAEELEM